MEVTPITSSITHTGQVIVPAGTRAFQINVISGWATVGGTVYPAGTQIDYTSADSKAILGVPLAVGATGVGYRSAVFYAQ